MTFDLIILDLNMPRLNGMQFLEAYKSIKTQKDHIIPIIIFSNSSRKSDIEKCLHLGADDYIVKPCTLEEQKNILDSLFNKWVVNQKTHCL